MPTSDQSLTASTSLESGAGPGASKKLVHLFGTPRFAFGHEVRHLPQTRPGALLAYLAATRTWVSRERLAYLFRADSPEPVARHYVRNLLNRARSMPAVTTLEVEATRCQWLVDTDLARFHSAIQAEQWAEALTWYGGRFLEGVTASGSPLFENWMESMRRELHGSWRRATLRFAASMESSRQHEAATRALAAFRTDDPLDEVVLRAFLRNTYLDGKRSEALAAADEFTLQLDLELGLPPLPETEELIAAIRGGDDVRPLEEPRSPGRRWNDAATGGGGELQQLVDLLKDPRNRLQTVVESLKTGSEIVVLTRRVSGLELVNHAIVELVDMLIDQGHGKRAFELLVLVLSQTPELDHRLHDRVHATLDRLSTHVPPHLISAARARW